MGRVEFIHPFIHSSILYLLVSELKFTQYKLSDTNIVNGNLYQIILFLNKGQKFRTENNQIVTFERI